MSGVEEILLRVVVGRNSNDDIFRILIGSLPIRRGRKIQISVLQIVFNELITDRRQMLIDQVHLITIHIHRDDLVVLCQQSGNTHAHIAHPRHGNLYIWPRVCFFTLDKRHHLNKFFHKIYFTVFINPIRKKVGIRLSASLPFIIF